jgi:hypothetical protein
MAPGVPAEGERVAREIDFSEPEQHSNVWAVTDANGKEVCRVRAKGYDAALLKARNHRSTEGLVVITVTEVK